MKSRLINRRALPGLVLLLLILSYSLYFSGYSLNRHATLNSYAADLSLIDQPLWNTVRGPGGFMEQTWGQRQQPRLAEHFEPLLIPVALLFFIWDDVRSLLIAQSVALALGALPLFWIARRQFTLALTPQSSLPSWLALAFAAAYLLYPHLQAANIADFHADPFVVAPLLFAFWYATQRRWGWMWLWAGAAMLSKETLPPLTAMLGLWLVLEALRAKPWAVPHSSLFTLHSSLIQGVLLILVSAAWFLIATFLIVAPLAGQYFGTEGPIYLANRFGGDSAGLAAMLQDPARWRYVVGLLAAAGFLPLLAPEFLLLGLPVLAANFFSNFPGQYSGEQHYSAPLVAAFMIAAIYGAQRLAGWLRSLSKKEEQEETTSQTSPSATHPDHSYSLRENSGRKKAALLAVSLWLLAWSLGYQARHGWTPLSLRLETYRPTTAARLLPQFTAQIPPDAVVSASAAVHPHLAHRRVIYLFPIVQEAEYLLVDVTDIPGVHPHDARARLLALLDDQWRLLRAEHGLLLAQKGSTAAPDPLPDRFFDFTRSDASPRYPTPLTFGQSGLRLLGYDLHDDPDDGVTIRFYWQTDHPLPPELKLWPLLYDDLGRLLSDPTQVPLVAALWYPPAAWQPGELIVTETLPQLLPDTFHLGLAVGLGEESFADVSRRLSPSTAGGESQLYPGRWAQLASFSRQGPFLRRWPPRLSLRPFQPRQVRFGPALTLTGLWRPAGPVRPGQTLPLLLRWQAGQRIEQDLTVFVHLLDESGRRVAQSDAYPTWLTPQPTSAWPSGQPILDRHLLALPPDLPPGRYTLQAGLYHAPTLARLSRPSGETSVELGTVVVAP